MISGKKAKGIKLAKPKMRKLPNRTIKGRLTTIHNAFSGSILPKLSLPAGDWEEILAIFGMLPGAEHCVYCGSPSTTLDHLFPLVKDKRPSGYLDEIWNVVPACGDCNSAKTGNCWRDYIRSPKAAKIPKKDGLSIDVREQRIDAFIAHGNAKLAGRPRRLDLNAICGDLEEWTAHWETHSRLVQTLEDTHVAAKRLRELVTRRIEDLYPPGAKSQGASMALPPKDGEKN